MNEVHCDFCKRIMESNDCDDSISMNNGIFITIEYLKDVCPACRKKFKDFITREEKGVPGK